MLAQHRPHRELKQRHPARDKLPDGVRAPLQPQVARIQPVGLHGDERLRDELLLQAERLQRGPLARGITVEGEDDPTPDRWQAITSV